MVTWKQSTNQISCCRPISRRHTIDWNSNRNGPVQYCFAWMFLKWRTSWQCVERSAVVSPSTSASRTADWYETDHTHPWLDNAAANNLLLPVQYLRWSLIEVVYSKRKIRAGVYKYFSCPFYFIIVFYITHSMCSR